MRTDIEQLFDIILQESDRQTRMLELIKDIVKIYDKRFLDLADVIRMQHKRINELEGRLFAKEHTYK